MAETLTEKVARAICAAGFFGAPDDEIRRAIDEDWPEWLDEARAAIAVVIEEAVKVAVRMSDEDEPGCDPTGIWHNACLSVADEIRRLAE